MKTINLLAVLSIIALSFASCTKDDNPKTESDNSVIAAYATINAINTMDVQTGSQVNSDNSAGKSLNNSCAVVSIETETTTFPKTFYVDFGSGCTVNGITRKGKLKITFSGYLHITGNTMTIERENYFINDKKVEGVILYKNTTANIAVPQWTRTVIDGKFTDNGVVFLHSGTNTTRQTAGFNTVPLADNIFEIFEGKYFISKKNGDQITLTINEALVKNYSCDYVSKGKLNVEGILLNGVVDYGNGDCDNQAIYTQNGEEYPFLM